jgi:hypothetical protein
MRTTAHYYLVIGRHMTNGTERRRDEPGKNRDAMTSLDRDRPMPLLDHAPASTRRQNADRRRVCGRVHHRWWLPKKIVGGVRHSRPARDIILSREARDG